VNKQYGLFGNDKVLRAKQMADGQLDMFGAAGSEDWGRRSRPQSDDKLTLVLQHEDPRRPEQKDADAQKAAEAATPARLWGLQVTTPFAKQVAALKAELDAQALGAILLVRIGDFYEAFGPDATHLAHACDLVVTSRPVSVRERLPMAGFPRHTLEAYVQKAVEKGWSVGVAEQVTEPDGNGLVERKLIRIERGNYTDAGARPVADDC
jgi:hypothetical protein